MSSPGLGSVPVERIGVALVSVLVLLVAFEFPSNHSGRAEQSSTDSAGAATHAIGARHGPPAPGGSATGDVLTPSERDLVAWARQRFVLVGLELPAVDVSFHDGDEPCRGHSGRFQRGRAGRRVAVCVPDWGTAASDLQRQRTLVHEFAHAWDDANLDPDGRAELLEILDATDWYAPESKWDERGVERFAETIVWGLYDQPRRPVLTDVPCAELHADFISITGVTAPGPIESNCHPASVGARRDRGASLPAATASKK